MRSLLSSALLALALWQSPLASAQPNTPVVSEETSNQTKLLTQSAEAAYQVGDFSSALEDYSLSYSLSQDPQLLFFIARCQQQLRQYQDAIHSYQRFLERSPGPLSEEERREVESLILEAEELDKQQRPDPTPRDADPDAAPKSAALLWSHTPARAYAPYVAVSGLALVSAAIAMTFSIQTANNVEETSSSELITPEQLKRGRSLSLLLAAGADVLILTSAITGTIGVLKWRDQKRELSAKASTNTLWLQLRY
jgi:tetratricopeptide (TPR) repeat protein